MTKQGPRYQGTKGTRGPGFKGPRGKVIPTFPLSHFPTRRGRAALLLEVLVALSIMVAAMGMLGAQLVSGLQMTAYADLQTRANELADRILGLLELDPQTQQQVLQEQGSSGDFGLQYPGFFWRVTLDKTDTDGLNVVTIQILHQENAEGLGDIEAARVVRELHLLKTDPGRINLSTDFGMTDDQITALAQAIPLADFDPAALNPQALVALDPQTLMQLLPALMPLLQQLMGSKLNLNLPEGASPEEVLKQLEDQGIDVQALFGGQGMPGGGQGGQRGQGGPGGQGGRGGQGGPGGAGGRPGGQGGAGNQPGGNRPGGPGNRGGFQGPGGGGNGPGGNNPRGFNPGGNRGGDNQGGNNNPGGNNGPTRRPGTSNNPPPRGNNSGGSTIQDFQRQRDAGSKGG